jgi:hypothetical protein
MGAGDVYPLAARRPFMNSCKACNQTAPQGRESKLLRSTIVLTVVLFMTCLASSPGGALTLGDLVRKAESKVGEQVHQVTAPITEANTAIKNVTDGIQSIKSVEDSVAALKLRAQSIVPAAGTSSRDQTEGHKSAARPAPEEFDWSGRDLSMREAFSHWTARHGVELGAIDSSYAREESCVGYRIRLARAASETPATFEKRVGFASDELYARVTLLIRKSNGFSLKNVPLDMPDFDSEREALHWKVETNDLAKVSSAAATTTIDLPATGFFQSAHSLEISAVLPDSTITGILESHAVARPSASRFRGDVTADLVVEPKLAATSEACRSLARGTIKGGVVDIRIPIRLEISSIQLMRRGVQIVDLPEPALSTSAASTP